MPPKRGEPPEPLPGIIDSHSHISWSREFDDDRPAVLDRAWAAGLTRIVEVGVSLRTTLACKAAAEADPRFIAVGGIHPHEANQLPRDGAAFRAAIEAGGYAAIGEIGLDFFHKHSTPEEQYEALAWQLDLALDVKVPVMIHARDADEECFAILAGWSERAGSVLDSSRPIGMMHCFSGDLELAQRYIDIGFVISVPGTVTFKGNERGQTVARDIPLTSMLVETDCPYLTPAPHRGLRNEPAYVVETARFVAALRGVSPEEVARATSMNAARFFGFEAPFEAVAGTT